MCNWRKMKSLNNVGFGLSVIFGCLFMALFAELYYLIWWKKRIASRGSRARQLLYLFCWKSEAGHVNQGELCNSMGVTAGSTVLVHQPEGQPYKLQKEQQGFLFKPFGNEDDDIEEEELMISRQSELTGPPRFLFTIVEETNEDLESEDGKSSSSLCVKSKKRLSDFLITAGETPYLTPLASPPPPFFTPPLTPMKSYSHNGFNPLFESASDAEFNRIKSSPPPQFKFMQDAEEKLRRNLSAQSHSQTKLHNANAFARHSVSCRSPNSNPDEVVDGSLITILVDRNEAEELNCHHRPH